MTRPPVRPRRRWSRRTTARCGAVATISLLTLLIAQPVAGVVVSGDPPTRVPVPGMEAALPSLALPSPALPSLPPLPVPTVKLPTPPPVPVATPRPLPTLPLPTLPLPTLPPLPSLPVPTLPPLPSLPVPTPSPQPSLPLPTLSPLPSVPPLPTTTPDPTGSTDAPTPTPSGEAAAGSEAPAALAVATPGSSDGPIAALSTSTTPTDQDASPLDFIVPGLVVGIPMAIVILIVLAQVAGGAAWLPLVRRWLARRV